MLECRLAAGLGDFEWNSKNKALIISALHIKKSDPDWIQTNDPKLRRFVLYSAELPGLTVLPRKRLFGQPITCFLRS